MSTPPAYRLGANFHETFLPECAYLAKILDYVACGKHGSKEDIGAETRIPTGKSSGKVLPTLRYAEGMGLLERPAGGRYENRPLALTALGREIHAYDPELLEPITLWLLHLHLCRRVGGAELWHQVFACSYPTLGLQFQRADLEGFLVRELGEAKLAPLVGMYSERASFASAGILAFEGPEIKRRPAPQLEHFARGYAYMVLSLFEQTFPGERQVDLRRFEEETSFFATTGWNERQRQQALDALAACGALRIERQLGDAVLTRLLDAPAMLEGLYEELP